MRASLVRNAAFGLLAVGAVGLAACNDNPLDEDREATTDLFINPTDMVVEAEGSSSLTVHAVNSIGEPTFAPVTAQAAACGGAATISVTTDPGRVTAEPPEEFIVTAGAALGSACVIVESSGVTDTVAVTVVGDQLVVTSAPDTVIAGQGAAVAVDLLGAGSGSAGGFDPANATFEVSEDTPPTPLTYPGEADVADVVTITGTPEPGSFTTEQVGTATILVTYDDASGRATRTVTHSVTVVPGPPDSAFVNPTAVDTAVSLGIVGAQQDTTLEVIVVDALGNWNTLPAQIQGLTVTSSDPAVATVEDSLSQVASAADSTVVGEHHVVFTATSAVGGETQISGTVQTSGGDVPFGPVTLFVAAPIVTAVPPGPPAGTITITGSAFVLGDFETSVIVDGSPLGNLTSITNNAITAQMPTFAAAGDFPLVVTVGGIPSDTATWTQVGGFDESTTEPVNNDPATAPGISTKFSFGGGTGGADIEDFFAFTLSDSATVLIDLDWNTSDDFDVIVQPAATAIPFDGVNFTNYGNDVCGNTAATGAKPEHAECADLAPGDYVVHIIDFNNAFSGVTTPKEYTVTGTIAAE